MIELRPGQTYTTESADDALRVGSGSVDIFLVPVDRGVTGRPMFVMHAEEGETVPGVAFTDSDYVTWHLRFEATEEAALRLIEGGTTRPLKKKMCRKIQVSDEAGGGDLEKLLVDMYLSREINDDVLITRRESRSEAERKKTEDILSDISRGREGTGSKDEVLESDAGAKKAAKARSLNMRNRAGAILYAAVLTAIATTAIFMMDGRRTILPIMCIVLAYISFRWIVHLRINRVAEKEAFEHQKNICRAFYSGMPAGSGTDDGQIDAAIALRSYDRDRAAVAEQMKALAGLLTAIGIFVVSVAAFPVPVTVAVITVLLSAVLMTAVVKRSDIGRKRAGSFRDRAQRDLKEAIYRIEKVRLAGASEHVIHRYYDTRKSEKDVDRRRVKEKLTGEGLIMAIVATGALLISIGMSPGNGSFAGQIDAAALACGFILFEGLGGSYSLAVKRERKPDPISGKTGQDGSASDKGKDVDLASIPEGDPIIEVEGVCFSYGEGEVCSDIDMKIHKGEHLAIVGASGSGKSTLIRLLSGMLTPVKGKVLFLGEPVGEREKDELRTLSSIVMQNDQLLTASIRENIMAADHRRGSADLERAAGDSGLIEDIREMPMGFDTQIREDGENISAGQKQKIMIARALVKDPRIVFFDEAESELDPGLRESIQEALRSRKITAITISHQYASVKKCDRIIVMEKGRIAEYGPPDELIEKKGHFYSLMHRQM